MACNMLLELLLLLLLLLTSKTIQVNASRLLSEEQPNSSSELETISGFVFCDSCHDNQLYESSIVFQDVPVLINCSTNFSGIAVTSKTGEYRIQLPTNVAASSCSVQLLTAPSLSSCSLTSGQLQATTRTTTNHDIVYKPYKAFPSCTRRRQALTLGPPDPPNPSGKPASPPARSSSSSSFRSIKGLHLGPPDPPRPVSRSKHFGPSHG